MTVYFVNCNACSEYLGIFKGKRRAIDVGKDHDLGRCQIIVRAFELNEEDPGETVYFKDETGYVEES